MPDIDTYLANIQSAVYGEQVRSSIHDAIEEINEVVENWESGLMDTTLTSTTLPAQGKAVGDAVNDLRSALMAENFALIRYDELQEVASGSDRNVYAFRNAVYLEAGDYYLSCIQHGDLTNVTRNCFVAKLSNTIIYDTSNLSNLKSGFLCWRVTLPTPGEWSFYRWIIANSEAMAFSNFVLSKYPPNLEYYYNTENAIGALYGQVYCYASGKPKFNISGTSVVVTQANGTNYRGYYIKNGLLTPITFSMQESVTVPHDHYLAFDSTNSTLVAVTLNQIVNNKGRYVICFYNSSGYIKGDWAKYNTTDVDTIKSNLSLIGEVGFIGVNRPTLKKTGTSIVVKLPNIALLSYLNAISGNYVGRSYVSLATTEYTVPAEKLFVFDITNQTFDVVDNTYFSTNNTNQYIFCFLNSNGYVRGNWEKYILARLRTTANIGAYIDFNAETEPNIYKQNATTLYIVIPSAIRIVRYDYETGTIYASDARTSNITEATLEHNQALVYDLIDFQFKILSGSTTEYENVVVCVYNSGGTPKGQWYKYWLHQQIGERGDVPYYWWSHLDNKESIINTIAAQSGAKGDCFVFVTDIHITSNHKQSPALVKDIIKHTAVNKTIIGGDCIDQESTKTEAIKQINDVYNKYACLQSDLCMSIGNHEFNDPGLSQIDRRLTATELVSSIRYTNQFCVRDDTLAYYFDSKPQKIRYFVGASTAGGGFDAQARDWLISEIPQTPAGWSVVLITHSGIYGGTPEQLSVSSEMQPIVDLLDAIKTRGTYSYNDNYYDFSNSDLTIICGILGHLHFDGAYTSQGGIKYILTDTDSAIVTASGNTKTKGTITEQAFDVFQFDQDARKIYCTRIGAGQDREFSY